MDTCPQCRSAYTWRSYPRLLRDAKDEAWARDYGKRMDPVTLGTATRSVTWIERLFCDCGWRAQLRAVDGQLLELLLPDPLAQREIYRRTSRVPR